MKPLPEPVREAAVECLYELGLFIAEATNGTVPWKLRTKSENLVQSIEHLVKVVNENE